MTDLVNQDLLRRMRAEGFTEGFDRHPNPNIQQAREQIEVMRQTIHPEDTIGLIVEHDSPPPRYAELNPPNQQVSGVGAYIQTRKQPYSYHVHDTYSACDLPNIPWKETQPKSEEDTNMSQERQWLPEDFPFAGTIVTLNPENVRSYEEYKEQHGDKLIVVNHEADGSTLDTILHQGNKHMPGWNVKCHFLKDGSSATFVSKQLLILDEPHRAVERIMMSNGNNFYSYSDMKGEAKANLEYQIITKGRTIERREAFDLEFRNKKISDAYMALNERAQREEARRPKPKKVSARTSSEEHSVTEHETIDLASGFPADDSEF